MNEHPDYVALENGAFILRGFALRYGEELQRGVTELQKTSQHRCPVTPSGLSMSSVATTCFTLGWTTIERSQDCHLLDMACAAMPDVLRRLGRDAAAMVGFNDFVPDVGLASASPGGRVSLHQEMNSPPGGKSVVAFPLGTASAFLFKQRGSSVDVRRISLWHGDVVVWRPADTV